MDFSAMETILWVLGLAFIILWLHKNLSPEVKTGKRANQIIQKMIIPFSNRWN